MRLFLVIMTIVFIAPAARATSYPPLAPPAGHEESTSVEAIKFREAKGTTTPLSLPKSWKLISVSTGEKANTSNLWFQDTDGSIYLLQGFTSQNKFYIHENAYKIPAK